MSPLRGFYNMVNTIFNNNDSPSGFNEIIRRDEFFLEEDNH
jgi:hypothetical protein